MSILNFLQWLAGGPNVYRDLVRRTECLAQDLSNSVADRGLLEQREQTRTGQLEQAIEALYAEIEDANGPPRGSRKNEICCIP